MNNAPAGRRLETNLTDALSATYTPTLADLGKIVQIQEVVSDTTPLVHPSMAGEALKSSHTWTFRVSRTSYSPVVLR